MERAGEASVSVVIPTFDRAHLLPRALDSVYAQTRPAEEVIVVDDGSTDGTAELVRRRYPRARLLRQPNRGVGAARNRGIGAAGGEWIALLDSDDAWRPAKLERQLAALAAQPEIELCHTDEIWIRRGVRVNPGRRHAKAGGRIFRRCLPRCVISPSSVVIRRRLLFEVGLFDESLPACEDYDLWLRVCRRRPVLFLDEPLVVKYGGHEDQLSRRVWGLDRFRIRALEKVLESGDLEPGDREATRAVLVEKIRIVLHGARKRERLDAVRRYEEKLRRWQEGPVTEVRSGAESRGGGAG